ncbi:MAG: glycoside hydrolase family 2 protein [Bacteroidota bacterium]
MNFSLLLGLVFTATTLSAQMANIPLPEHPRPDWERAQWQNLNGNWQFAFDSLDRGQVEKWHEGRHTFPQTISVPFPWGSRLSGVANKADIAWYQRNITVNSAWNGKRTFLTIGASDWHTTVWLDGQYVGEHKGGYVPFSFDLTPLVTYDRPQRLTVRVDDKRRDFTLYGKQGYGNARGIWQTVYLEARGTDYLQSVQFVPNIDNQTVTITAYLPDEANEQKKVTVTIQTPQAPIRHEWLFEKGKHKAVATVSIPNPRLWSLADPYLYQAELTVGNDVVKTYFGMRKISVMNLPGTEFPYVALNNQPVYLQLTLDQSYHPDGFYTFPTDEFMRQEIERTKAIGLNGIRPHIKVEIPRKLYWADKLGVLVMADLPNSWGEPDHRMQQESEYTLRGMLTRDFNHPSVFSWILFNETWGLRTQVEEGGKKQNQYLPSTQQWVASMYYLAKSLDPTRLVEDNSICCGAGHTVTDLNSFHDYLPGWEWEPHLKQLTEQSFEGSTFQFEAGFRQGKQPKINSECGNVWGYEGSTGDVDWSWDYHRMMNTFRKYPEIAGWLYTEHHDVINEWNGYWRFDRSLKFTGLEECAPGMTLNDLHAPVYVSTGNEICRTVRAGEKISIPLFISSMSGDDHGKTLKLSYQAQLTNVIGESAPIGSGEVAIEYQPYLQKELAPLSLTMPNQAGLAVVAFTLSDQRGKVLHRNFMHVEIVGGAAAPKAEVITQAANGFTNAGWSSKQWQVLDGLKVCGAGKGFFEYTFPVGTNLKVSEVKDAYFVVEASAKELFAKDRDTQGNMDLDYMLGARALPSANPNAYPMTDEQRFPSEIEVLIDGEKAFTTLLADDPADHRGVLSWHHQLQDRKLREAGSYGYLVKVKVTPAQLKKAAANGKLTVRLQTKGEGGLAIYGQSFGRYPVDPSLVLKMK